MADKQFVQVKTDEIAPGEPEPQDVPIVGEKVRSLLTRYWEIDAATHERVGVRPKDIEAQVQWIAGAPLGVVVPPGSKIVQISYTNATSTPVQVQAAVAAVPAATLLLEVLGSAVTTIKSASLGSVGPVDLYTELFVPGAPAFIKNTEGRWVPYDGGSAGMAALLAVLNLIQTNTLSTVANTSPDNRCGGTTHSLAGALVDHSLGISGRTLAILGLDGTASIRLVNAGGIFPTAPAPALDVFPLDRWTFDFTDVLLTCAAQPGKNITLYAGWRV